MLSSKSSLKYMIQYSNKFNIKIKETWSRDKIFNTINMSIDIKNNTLLSINNTKNELLDYAESKDIYVVKSWNKQKILDTISKYLDNKKTDTKSDNKKTDTKQLSLNTYEELLLYILQNNIVIKDFINSFSKGRGIEALFNIIYPLYNKKYIPSYGNFNKGTVLYKKGIEQYLKLNIIRNSDKSDLTLIDEKKKIIVTLTSKHKNKYQVGELDIDSLENIFNEYKNNEYKDYSHKIIILIDVKNKLYESIKNSKNSSEYLSAKIEKLDIYDIKDIENMYNKIKIEYKNIQTIQDIINIYNDKETKFKLRFGQYLITQQTKNIIEDEILNNSKTFKLINGSVCRFGKSYCIAQDILNINEMIDNKILEISPKFMFITSEPKTISKIMDIFKKYKEFKKFKLYNLHNDTSDIEYKKYKNETNISISFISIQTLRNKTEKYIKNILPEICLIDEFHKEGLGKQSDNTMELFKKKNIIFYSATYKKIESFYKILNKHIITWTLQDNIDCKNITNIDNKNNLIEKYGLLVDNGLQLYTTDEIEEYYNKIPSFYFIIKNPTLDTVNIFNDINQNEETKDIGYSFSSIKMLTKIGNDYKLKDENAVISWFQNTFFGYTKQIGDDEYLSLPDNSAYDIYLELCSINKQRIKYIDNKEEYPLIIPIYMGKGIIDGKQDDNKELDSIIYKTCILIKKLLEDNSYKFSKEIDDYKFIIHTSYKSELTDNNEDIEESFDRIVKKYKKKKAIFLLLGESLTTGITNKYCDLISLTDTIKSEDKFIQTIFRSFNESYNGFKKHSYIILDNFQSSSLLDIIKQYRNKNETDKQTWSRILSQQLINICKYDKKDKYILTDTKEIDNFYTDIKKNTTFTKSFSTFIDSFMKNFEFNIIIDSDLLKLLATNLYNKGDIKREQKIKDILDSTDKIKNGIKEEKKLISDTKSTTSSLLSSDDIDYIYKNYSDNVICLISLLICLSTSFDNIKFENIIDKLKETKNNDINLYDLLISQLSNQFSKSYTKTEKLILKLYAIFTKDKFILNKLEEEFFFVRSRFIEDNNKHNIIERYNNILSIIKTTDIEKKHNAEILTPISLATDMINKIPIDFWTSNLSCFDPCCGKGIFTILLYDKLMNSLESKIVDKKERRKHILEKLIYFSDINEFNVYITKFLLDPFNEYKLNYNIGNTLEIDIKNKWKIEGFGLVIGNPPYNSSGGTNTGNTIWQNFVKKTIEKWVIKDGYIVYVHPPGWRKPDSKKSKFSGLFNLMCKDNQMIYLEIHNIKDGKQIFNAGTRYDWYIIEKKKKYTNTLINNEFRKNISIDIKNFIWIPNSNINIISKLIDKKEKLDILNDFSYSRLNTKIVQKYKDAEFKYPLIYLTPKNGVRYMYSNTNNNGHFNISKVIIGETGLDNAINDYNGIYGMTQDSFGIIINNYQEGEDIIKALKTNKFRKILKSCMWSNFRIDWRLFKSFNIDFWKQFI